MIARSYNCKDEEIPVIGGYLLFVVRRDMPELVAYLPGLFTNEYVAGMEKKITDVSNLLNPKNETVELKTVTTSLYGWMDGLVEPLNKVKVYLDFAKGAIPVSVKDFGITALKRSIHSKDSEGVIKNLRSVSENLERYRAQLMERGFDGNIVVHFENSLRAIEAENQRQFEIVSNRKAIVESNVGLINDLYANIIEICNIGKMMYKGKNELKVKEYTFNQLRKSVRNN
jgi:hypothetical protein